MTSAAAAGQHRASPPVGNDRFEAERNSVKFESSEAAAPSICNCQCSRQRASLLRPGHYSLDNAKVYRLLFLTMLAALGMLTSANVAVALPLLSAPSSLHFPNGVGEGSVVVTNIGSTAITISGLTFTGDPPVFPSLGYFILSPLTITSCNIAYVMPPGGTCTVTYEYVQLKPGANSELVSLTLGFNATASFETMLVNLVADPPANQGRLSANSIVNFGYQLVDTASAAQAIVVTNVGTAAVSISGVYLSDTTNFAYSMSGCSTITVGSSCTINVTFSPQSTGTYNAKITITSDGTGSPQYISLVGVGLGGGGPGPTFVPVIEFYNATLDHYFITWMTNEIRDLDTGVHPGWARTGNAFKAYATPQTGTSPVCRFYIPPALGDSHFFGRGQKECDDTATKFPTFDVEDPAFMQMYLPVAGVCPANTTEVYRVFSNRSDANHRYMTDKAVRQTMVDRGWLPEGDGPNLVVMCAPQ